MADKTINVLDLYSDQKFKDQVISVEQLNAILNQEPPADWVKIHPFIKNYKYLPIDKIEFMLRRFFKRYRIDIKSYSQVLNGVVMEVRVHYYNAIFNEWDYYDGIGAVDLQAPSKMKYLKDDFTTLSAGALSMAFPIAKTVAIKDACDHFGNIFGANLNRKDTVAFEPDPEVLNLEDQKIKDRIVLLSDEAKTEKEIKDLIRDAKKVNNTKLKDNILQHLEQKLANFNK